MNWKHFSVPSVAKMMPSTFFWSTKIPWRSIKQWVNSNRIQSSIDRHRRYLDWRGTFIFSLHWLGIALLSFSLVVARYADDGKWYRAWIKSICLDRKHATVFFVDFGNESSVAFTDICSCPESVRSLPWLGIRIRLTDETMAYEELTTFWKLAESNYIWIRIVEVFNDSYGVQIKLDYTVFLRQERAKVSSSHRLIHTGVQTDCDEIMLPRSASSEVNSSAVITPTLTDQSPVADENLLRNLFEMITKELRHLRHRINDSDEASQDRHSQLMQLLFSSFNLNNSNNSKRLWNVTQKSPDDRFFFVAIDGCGAFFRSSFLCSATFVVVFSKEQKRRGFPSLLLTLLLNKDRWYFLLSRELRFRPDSTWPVYCVIRVRWWVDFQLLIERQPPQQYQLIFRKRHARAKEPARSLDNDCHQLTRSNHDLPEKHLSCKTKTCAARFIVRFISLVR